MINLRGTGYYMRVLDVFVGEDDEEIIESDRRRERRRDGVKKSPR